MTQQTANTTYDVVLVGGGIMSATLGAFLKQLEPTWSCLLYTSPSPRDRG